MRAATLLALLAAPCLAAASTSSGTSPECAASTRVDTTSWRRVQAGAYSIRLPPAYRSRETGPVDSDLRGWSAPGGRRVSSDFGFYSGAAVFEPGADSSVVVCEPGAGTESPRIVFFSELSEGRRRYVAGLYWVTPEERVLGGPPHQQVEALNVFAGSPRKDDLPELLAIIRSVHANNRAERQRAYRQEYENEPTAAKKAGP